MAEVLKDYGYSTAAFGKWHNTPAEQTTAAGPFDYWPIGYGFEYFYGFLAGEASPLPRAGAEEKPAPAPPKSGWRNFGVDVNAARAPEPAPRAAIDGTQQPQLMSMNAGWAASAIWAASTNRSGLPP